MGGKSPLIEIKSIFPIPKTNSSPLKIKHPKRKVVFQPSIFRCHVSFRGCISKDGCNFSIDYAKPNFYDKRVLLWC